MSKAREFWIVGGWNGCHLSEQTSQQAILAALVAQYEGGNSDAS